MTYRLSTDHVPPGSLHGRKGLRRRLRKERGYRSRSVSTGLPRDVRVHRCRSLPFCLRYNYSFCPLVTGPRARSDVSKGKHAPLLTLQATRGPTPTGIAGGSLLLPGPTTTTCNRPSPPRRREINYKITTRTSYSMDPRTCHPAPDGQGQPGPYETIVLHTPVLTTPSPTCESGRRTPDRELEGARSRRSRHFAPVCSTVRPVSQVGRRVRVGVGVTDEKSYFVS